ncbi:MAG: class I SAM-dependent methyltransferase [Clostridia bacterium]|nr:class I SAM-dependent methyltransferase [Clostridia bacterium]
METNQFLKAYYESRDEDVRLASRHGSVEFLTTMRYIERYLQADSRILEIGAGTGRYSHALARMGYRVDAVELIEHNIEVFRAKTAPGEAVSVVQGNALDLSAFADHTYDLTLLLGPIYHLYTEADQRQALSEAVRVTKPGGIIFVAYCNNDATMVQTCFGRGLIRDEHFRALIDPVTFRASSTPAELFQLNRKEDADALISGLPVKRLHYLGTDMATCFLKDCVDAMDDEMFELYLRYHFSICERPDMVGATHHMLDILRKEETR